jgi:hypothetical protein
MIKKHANDPIPAIVDLGDNRFEFCYNQAEEQREDHTDYVADYIVLDMPVEKQSIVTALMVKGHTEQEANELTATL